MDLGLVIGVGLSIVALWALVLVILWLSRPKGVPVREMVGVVPDVLRLLRSLITDGSVPLDVRIVLVGLLLWIVSPIDLIPEFIPALGPLDDVLVAVAAMRYVRHRLGVDELLRRWSGSVNGFAVLTRVIGSS